MSEILTGAVEPASQKLGFTPLFAGVFLLATVGNGAEMLSAIRFARKDKMDLAIGITVGASTQVALLVAPILVFAGRLMGKKDMNLLFTRVRNVGGGAGGLHRQAAHLRRRIDLARGADASGDLLDARLRLLSSSRQRGGRALTFISKGE